MPQVALGALIAAGAATAAAVAASSFAFFSFAAAAFFAKTFAVSIISGYLLQELSPKPSQPSALTPGVRGSSQIRQDSVIPQRWIVGRARVLGALVWARHSEFSENTLHMVQVIGASAFHDEPDPDNPGETVRRFGGMEGIERIWIDGEEIEVTRNTNADEIGDANAIIEPAEGSRYYSSVSEIIRYENRTRTVTRGIGKGETEEVTYTERVPIRRVSHAFRIFEYFKGDGTQGEEIRRVAETEVDREDISDPLPWTEDHKLTGVCYVLIRLKQPEYENTPEGVQGRLYRRIPNIEFQVKGIRIRHPVLSHPTTLSPYVWTENAAALRFWFMTQRRNINPDSIDKTYFVSAYNQCANTLMLGDASNYREEYPQQISRYTINGSVNANDSAQALDAQFDLCWQGKVVEWGGQFLFRPGVELPASLVISEDVIIDHPVIRPALPRENRANEVAIDIEQSAVEEFRAASFQVVDDVKQASDNERLPIDLVSQFQNHPVASINIMHQQLRLQRSSMEIDLRVMPGENFQFVGLIPGDKVEVQISEYDIGQGTPGTQGASAIRYFRVLSSSVSNDWSVNLSLAQWPDDWFNDTFVFPEVRQIRSIVPAPVPAPVFDGAPEIVVREGEDGAVNWEAIVRFNLIPGYTTFVWATRFEINLPEQEINSGEIARFRIDTAGTYTFYAFNQSDDGRRSGLTTITATVVSDISIITPVLISAIPIGNTLQIRLQNPNDRIVDGLEVRYTRGSVGALPGSLPALTEDNWDTALEMDAPTTLPRPGTGSPIIANVILPGSGAFRIFVRFHNTVGSLSPITEVGIRQIELAGSAREQRDAHPNWTGTRENMTLWSYNPDRGLINDRSDRNAMTFHEWNRGRREGETPGVFPFGRYDGWGQDYVAGTSTAYTTQQWDFGESQNVEVNVYVGNNPTGVGMRYLLFHDNAPITSSSPSVALTGDTTQVVTARYIAVRAHLRTNNVGYLSDLTIFRRVLS